MVHSFVVGIVRKMTQTEIIGRKEELKHEDTVYFILQPVIVMKIKKHKLGIRKKTFKLILDRSPPHPTIFS